MSKKEKVQFSHGEAFESVEDLLTEAIENLDQANERIQRLLHSESRGPEEAPPAAAPESSDIPPNTQDSTPTSSVDA